jgi:hypothetical protein
MSAALWILLAVLAIPLVLLIAVLVTPVQIGCIAHSATGGRLMIGVRLFGGLTPSIRLYDSARRNVRKKPPKAKQKKEKKKEKKKKKTKRAHQGLTHVRRTIAEPQLLMDLLKPIHIERLAIDADIGFADPADTGQLYGLLIPMIHSGLLASPVSIAVRPDFSGARLSGEIVAKLSFIPIAFLPPAVRFAWCVWGARS